AGLNPVEAAIAEIWRDLLGADEVGRDDDFFALGGHSLAAVRLFARVRKQFGADLPLATLFQAPTLGALAALVAQTAGIALEAAPQAQAEPAAAPAVVASASAAAANAPRSNVISLVKRSWSPLIEICKGDPERKPLFCVHGAGGNVLNFKPISDGLGRDQPFYGLQAQGVDGRTAPLSSVEAMATQYLEAIRAVHPQGPYRLAGYSAGGVIALEMAQQLRRAGSDVVLLAMVDTLSPTAARRKVSLPRKLWLMRHWSLRFLLDWPARRRSGRAMQVSYLAALEKIARGEPLPPELADFHLFRNFVAAQARYQPQPYAGDVVLFKATQSEMQYLDAGPRLGWEEHVQGEIRVTDIAGSHFSLMSQPGLSQLVEGLRRELAALDASGDGRSPQDAAGPRPPVLGVGRGALSPG
ncbi:MAG TPA: thioesterase domain-containing protein, partial [Ramlibacter sp.]|nr:thioesterase domain-containing protein [Ramlibacter sp.]